MKKYLSVVIASLALSTFAETEIYLGATPSVNGDGSAFVFEWNEHIWWASTQGGQATRLMTGGGRDGWPVLTADGTRMVFSSDRDGGARLYEFDFRTGDTRRLTRNSEASTPRQWFNGDKSILAVTVRDDAEDFSAVRIASFDTDKTDKRKIVFDAPGREPSLSPDGNLLLFTNRGEYDLYRKRKNSKSPSYGEIWMYDIAKTNMTKVIDADGYESRNAIWAPDGKGFYYLCNRDGVRNLYYHPLERAFLDFRSDRQLTFFTDEHIFNPAISGDGKTIVFRQGFHFYRLDPTAEKPEVVKISLTTPPGYEERLPTRRRVYDTAWNNDASGDVTFCDNGTQIALTAGGDLFVMDTRIREPKLVHGSSLTHERECVFSPDGMALYYISDRGDGTDLWKAERENPRLPWWENVNFKKTKLKSDREVRHNFSISPKGNLLAWQDAQGRFSFADTNGVVRANGPVSTDDGSYAWSPDGKYVVAQLADEFNDFDIYILSTSTNKSWRLTHDYKYAGEPTWSPDGQVIAWVNEIPEGNTPGATFLSYVYLDRAIEERESRSNRYEDARRFINENRDTPMPKVAAPQPQQQASTNEQAKAEAPKPAPQPQIKRPPTKTPFEDLWRYVRRTNLNANAPFFSWDSRTIAFRSGKETKTFRVNNKAVGKLFDKVGVARDWLKKNNKILWVVDRKPAIGNDVIPFQCRQETDIADYQELVFRTAWGRIRNQFYDPNCHGADWDKLLADYVPYARNAQSMSVFRRVVSMMLGSLDASHLGFSPNDVSRKEWEGRRTVHAWLEDTVHLGLRFDETYVGKGWRVRDVVPGSPVDRLDISFDPGDIIEAVNGIPVDSTIDPAEILVGPAGKTFLLKIQGHEIPVKSISYAEARALMRRNTLKKNRELVHEMSDGKFGYLHVALMDGANYMKFQAEVFSEGYGRDGLIIDVRHNGGGFTADRMLQILCGADHSRAVFRTAEGPLPGYLLGYWNRPVWTKPIVVLIDEKAGSNAEIFSHAIKTLKRGKLVGRETSGCVIATNDRPLLDFGTYRNAHIGWFLPDGTDMEHHGAVPDVDVDILPTDYLNKRDPQLERAIGELEKSVKNWKDECSAKKYRYAL